MKAREIMTADPALCGPWDPVTHAVDLMITHDCGSIPVVDPEHGRIIGIVTDRDITLRVVGGRLDPKSTAVGTVMSQGVVCCRADHDIDEVEQIMRSHRVRRVPVVDRFGRVVGIIAQADLAVRVFSQRSLLDTDSLARTLEHLSEPAPERPSLKIPSNYVTAVYRARGMRLAL